MSAASGPGRKRQTKNTVTTKSGNTIKLNQSLSDRVKSRRLARAAEKATYLSTLPKNRWKRLAYRLHPKRVAAYWFSRDGGIMALKIVGVAIVIGFFLTIGMFAYFRKDLPKIKDISGDNLGGSITYYDRTGTVVLWQDYDAVKRIGVQSDQISPYMKDATVAVEDKDFYKHGAFDVRGIMRAAVHDATGSSGTVQGGSTITQQLVKLNENWTDNRTITRKVKELILAVELEREYSKDDILTGYLNIAPYGGVDYGVESAAEDYFQTSAKNLTLAQSAMLAAIPQSPSYYSPYASTQFNPAVTDATFSSAALLDRQHYILDQMASQGYITKAQADAAKQVDVLAQVHQQESKYNNIKAPYFVLAAKQQLDDQYGAATVNRGGWKVITTLDMNLQTKAEQLIAANASAVRTKTAGLADDEATVGEDVQTGQIVDLVGGENFSDPTDGQLNFAASSLVGPGSTFKPYDYVTLINDNNNVGAGSVIYDQKTPLPGYSGTCPLLPTQSSKCPPGTQEYLYDYDYLNPGPITLRYALGGSRNIPAIKAMLEAVPNDKSNGYTTSINKVISTASALMDNPAMQDQHQSAYNCYATDPNTGQLVITQCYASSAIGDGELYLDDTVNGLSSIARLGQAIPRTFILKITDSANKNVYNWTQPKATQVVRPDAAYIVDNMASDPRASYLPGSCTDTTCTTLAQGGYKFHRDDNGWDFAIKTGTTDDGHDGLMASWSPHYATISWVGNHTRTVDISSITGISMEYLTEPLTRGMMEAAHAGLKPANWVQPKDIKVAPAYIQRTHIHYGDEEPGPTNDLFPSWYIGGSSTGKATSQTLDKVSGAVATSCTPAGAKEVVSNANVASWNIDIFVGGKQNIGSTSNSGSNISSSSATDSVHNCNDSPPTITLTAPGTCSSSDNGGQGCLITATVTQGTHPLSDPQYPQFPGTVTFTLGGQTIHTATVSDSPSTVSFYYQPTSSGSGSLAATVTDSVLYSGTDSSTLTYTATNPLSISSPSDGSTVTGASQTLSWSGGSGSYSASVNGSASPLCQSVSGSSCTINLTVGSNTIVLSDSEGDNPSQVTVTRSH